MQVINDQDAMVTGVVRRAIPVIGRVVEVATACLCRGGRLIYVGAGTSGRLGVLDASECPPTFHCDPYQVVGVICGGDSALRASSEGAEDDPAGADTAFKRLQVGSDDLVVGIAAGGTTPYVLGAVEIAKSRGATTRMICCVVMDEKPSQDLSRSAAADHFIELPVGPEVLTGSTRMKAGTATKLVLNMITTTTMVRLGKVWGNLMVDLRATNAKLRDRGARILADQCGLSRVQALDTIDRAGGRVKTALVMTVRGVDAKEARHLLDLQEWQLRPILGSPR